MKRRPLPQSGEIGPIDQGSRFYHVLDHLLNEVERWDLVCPGLGRDARKEALRRGCTERVLAPGSRRFELTNDACKSAMSALHNAHYEPTYRAALAWGQANGYWAFKYGTNEVQAVGELGICVAVKWSDVPMGWRVYSALRVGPRSDSSGIENCNFFDRAVRRWQAKTSKPSGSSP